MKKQELIIEKADVGYFARTLIEDNLIVEQGTSVEELAQLMKRLIKEFHQIDDIQFKIMYDLSALFENFNYLNISAVADLAGVNSSLLRQYVSGVKYPSSRQVKKIEDALHRIGNELKSIRIYNEAC